jgi:hypothetical protein
VDAAFCVAQAPIGLQFIRNGAIKFVQCFLLFGFSSKILSHLGLSEAKKAKTYLRGGHTLSLLLELALNLRAVLDSVAH